MNMNRNITFAVILILLGGLILIDKLGFGLGSLMNWIFPIVLLLIGYSLIKHRSGFIGWPLAILGGLILFGKLMGVIGWLVAIVLIIYGVYLLKNRERTI